MSKQSREPEDETESARRRKRTADDIKAVVDEVEDVAERVRTRSKRMRGPSASPEDLPPVTGPAPASERATTKTVRPPPPARDSSPTSEPTSAPASGPGATLPSMPASSRKGDSGRYSFVYKPKKRS